MLPKFEATRLNLREGFLSRLFPRARRPGPQGFQHAIDPETRRRHRRRQRRDRRRPLSQSDRGGDPRLLSGSRRGRQAAGKHLPRRQHRAGQRNEDGARRDGHRRVGSDQGRLDQAVRIPGVLSRPRPRRALHSDRSVLSHLEGARSRICRRGSSNWPARSITRCPTTWCRKTLLALNDRGKAMKDSQDSDAGPRVQAGRRRCARKPELRADRAVSSNWARTSITTIRTSPRHTRCAATTCRCIRIELSPASLKNYDCVLVATHHAAYDWQMIADHAQLIVDTRNAMRDVTGKRDHIVKG